MLLKLFRLLSSTIENRIVASLNDAVIEPEPFVQQSVGLDIVEDCRFFVKRILDIFLSFILLCISLPVFFTIMITPSC